MTGYGKGECSRDGSSVTVEVSSVNGRFFDLKAKMPKSLNEYEAELRSIVQEYIDRGRVTVTVGIDRPGLRAEGITIDADLAGKYVALAGDMAEKYGIDGTLDMRTLLQLPEIIIREENGYDASDMWSMVAEAARLALGEHKAMRLREGGTIGADMKKRLDIIVGTLDEIAILTPRAVEANTTRLRSRIESLIGSDAYDETRFATEVAMYADRVDITEERVRLASHCDQYASELTAAKTSGRKLSFLLQEMNREANTIASKSSDAEISQIVVRIKEELEKIREQAENME
jgi:uncharacterized protein (TIGR00255 family)